ncbi:MAG: 50S ribosomal protein L21e [archaeon]|nr:50S ribosomal protein L21e [archaeon]
MVARKKVRTRGKLQFSRYFQELKEGDKVAVIKELSVPSSFPKVLQGRTGKVLSKRGRSYMVLINDKNKEKKYILAPIHLKKIE